MATSPTVGGRLRKLNTLYPPDHPFRDHVTVIPPSAPRVGAALRGGVRGWLLLIDLLFFCMLGRWMVADDAARPRRAPHDGRHNAGQRRRPRRPSGSPWPARAAAAPRTPRSESRMRPAVREISSAHPSYRCSI